MADLGLPKKLIDLRPLPAIQPVRIPKVYDDEVPGSPGVYPGVSSPVHGDIAQCPVTRVQLVRVAGVQLDLSCVMLYSTGCHVVMLCPRDHLDPCTGDYRSDLVSKHERPPGHLHPRLHVAPPVGVALTLQTHFLLAFSSLSSAQSPSPPGTRTTPPCPR